jgi:hypothetical protein
MIEKYPEFLVLLKNPANFAIVLFEKVSFRDVCSG